MPVLALLTLFNVTGLRGVDFGYHWDEADYHIAPARHMIESGILLPSEYTYPSVDKWLVLLPALPSGIRAAVSGGDPRAVQSAMLATMNANGYLLRVRSVFIVVSSLAILWTYGAARALRHRRWEALVAAAGLGLSWEFAYHSRWAVTDCIVVQFSALTLFMLALFQGTGRPRWLYGAAVAAGLCTGTKYTGVFLLAGVVLASALTLPYNAYWAQVRRAVELCALAFAVYLITTPGTVLDPFKFRADTQFISTYYQHTHGGYTVTSGWQHAAVVLGFYALAFFSPYAWIAAPLFCFVIGGAVLWFIRDKRFAAVLVGLPLLFLTMFCARYRIAIVRNYLFLTPFLAVLLARGVSDFVAWLPVRPLRQLFGVGLLSICALQSGWLISAGESIRHVDPTVYVSQALDYVRQHADTRFRVSNQVRSIARAEGLALPDNAVTARGGDASQVVFFGRAEGPGDWHWRVNDPWLTKAVFGPREVDFNWYSSWDGHDRVVVMALDKARGTGVPLAR